MYRENEKTQEEEPSEVFRRFLESMARGSHLGGERVVKHSKNILRVFSKELPEKLYHSKRYSSQSTDGSLSGNFSPSQNQTSGQSPDGTWAKGSAGGKGGEKGDGGGGLLRKSLGSGCLGRSLELPQPGPAPREEFCSGEILDLELELEVTRDGGEHSPSGGIIRRAESEWGAKELCGHSNNTSATTSSSSSAINSPSSTPTSGRPDIYRVMTSSTATFPSYSDNCMERLNTALREDRIRRISTHSNRAWPSNVTAYLNGIDIFLKIPEYIRPSKDEAALNLSIGSCSHPHPSKVHYGGEDAHFYEENVIGIADGVGEWANFGINPKLFASELISGMRKAYLNTKCMQTGFPPNDVAVLKNNVHAKSGLHVGSATAGEAGSQGVSESPKHTLEGARLRPDLGFSLESGKEEGSGLLCWDSREVPYSQFLLVEGYNNTRSFGSSTAFVACFDSKTSKLQISYLGDSGIIVLRRTPETFRMGIVYRSPAQQHSFNCPFQLSKLPSQEDFPGLQENGLTCFINLVKNSEDVPQDLPCHSISKEIAVSQSDLIVIATDGLFDNLFDYEICSICSGAISPYESVQLLKNPDLYSSPHNISKALANAAYIKSLDPKAKTPFSKHCGVNSELWQFSTGGKLDDITVVVAWVVSESDQIVLNCRPDKLEH